MRRRGCRSSIGRDRAALRARHASASRPPRCRGRRVRSRCRISSKTCSYAQYPSTSGRDSPIASRLACVFVCRATARTIRRRERRPQVRVGDVHLDAALRQPELVDRRADRAARRRTRTGSRRIRDRGTDARACTRPRAAPELRARAPSCPGSGEICSAGEAVVPAADDHRRPSGGPPVTRQVQATRPLRAEP